MEISKITAMPPADGIPDKNKKIQINETGLKKDSFEPKKEEYNAEKFTEELKSIKKNTGKPKFNEERIQTIIKKLNEEPEKFPITQKFVNLPHLGEFVMTSIIDQPIDILEKLYSLAEAKNKKNLPKFDDYIITKVAKEPIEILDKIKTLAPTSLLPENILTIVKEPDLDINKLSNKVLSMEKAMGDTLSKIVFTKDNYDKNSYTINATTSNNTIKSELLDKNLNRQAIESIEQYTTATDKTFQIKKVNDLRNNTTSKIRSAVFDKRTIVTHEIRLIKDKKGNLQKTEYTEPSEIPGIFNIKHVFPNGKTDIICEGKIDKKTGITSVKKNMTSLDGTKTEYLYEDDPKGNRIIDYKITDNNGKVILKNSQSFEVINDNKFISSKNNETYEVNISKENIIVKNLKTKKETTIKLDEYITGNKEMLMCSLKQMPGEELLKLKQSTSQTTGIYSSLSSFYKPTDKTIHTADNLFVILHELGHATDFRDVNVNNEKTINNSIFLDDKLNKTFDDEKTRFTTKFPEAQREHINYFINHETHYGGEIGGLRETIAESNALLNTPKTHPVLGIRSQYLQQYFPKTIARLSTLLNTYDSVQGTTIAETILPSKENEWQGHFRT